MTDLDRVHIVTVYDGADFDRVLDRRAFATWADAEEQGRLRVAQLRGERRKAGERDADYIDAIRYDVQPLQLDEAWGRSKPVQSLTPRHRHAYLLNCAGRARRRGRCSPDTVRSYIAGAKAARSPHPWSDTFAPLP